MKLDQKYLEQTLYNVHKEAELRKPQKDIYFSLRMEEYAALLELAIDGCKLRQQNKDMENMG